MEILEVDGDYLKSDRSLYGGLLGVAIVTCIQLLGVSRIDVYLSISLTSFALAIPLLSSSLHSVMQEEQYSKSTEPWYVFLVNVAGVLGAFVGVVALFLHFSLATGICFTVSALCSGICRWRFDRALRKINPGAESA